LTTAINMYEVKSFYPFCQCLRGAFIFKCELVSGARKRRVRTKFTSKKLKFGISSASDPIFMTFHWLLPELCSNELGMF